MLISLIVRVGAPVPPSCRPHHPVPGVSTVAMLQLPSLNADIIDNGVATGDTGYIVGRRRADVAAHGRPDRRLDRRHLVQRRRGDGGRDATCAPACSTTSARSRPARSVASAPPSLITRNTNDVQQVQILVLMTFTMLVAAPIMAVGGIIMAMREGLVAVVAAARQRAGAGVRRRLHRQPDDPRLPQGAGAHRRHQPGAARADRRDPGRPRVRPRATARRPASPRPTTSSPTPPSGSVSGWR